MDIDAQLKKFVQLSCSARAQKGVSQSSFTPVHFAENRFIPQYMTFKYATAVAGLSGATAITLKNIKLTIDESIEDQEVLGSVAPADFLNKEFKVEGQLEAIYQNLTDFKNVSLATPNVAQAMLIDLMNTDVTLGQRNEPDSSSRSTRYSSPNIHGRSRVEGPRIPDREILCHVFARRFRNDEDCSHEHRFSGTYANGRKGRKQTNIIMAESKTKVLTTPSGASIELKEYISAGEFLDATETKDGEAYRRAKLAKRLVNVAVVSVNGSKENVPHALRDLPLPDYLFLSKEVAKLTNGDFTEAKNP